MPRSCGNGSEKCFHKTFCYVDKLTNLAGMLILISTAFHLSCSKDFHQDLPEKVDTHERAWKRKPLRCFYTRSSKAHVLKLETKSFGTELATTIVHVSDTLDDGDVCHNACSEERFVIAVHPTEEWKWICQFEVLWQVHEEWFTLFKATAIML